MDEKTEIFPPVSNGDQFHELYSAFLRRHSPSVVDQIRTLLQRLDVSPDVTDCEILAFPDEYGDGHVSVCMYFNGRNRHVRKNDTSLYCGACVFLTQHIRDIPLHDPSGYDFDVVEISVRCVIEWFSQCWRIAGGEGYKYPVTISGHEGLGSTGIVELSRGVKKAERSA